MGAYVVIFSDSKIFKRVAGFKSVVVLGCPGCANASIAYDKGIPLSRILVDKNTGETVEEPVAVMEEANRLKALLESKGINARVEMWPDGPCALSADSDPAYLELADRCTDAEGVVTLCCVGGTLGVKRYLGKTAKIISGMRTVGVFQLYTILDEAKEFVCIDKDKSRMIRMFKA